MIKRDLNKARIAFDGADTVATGNWGCGAFGNDHILKFLQQWLAASETAVTQLDYHTFEDPRSASLPSLARRFQRLTVGQLWTVVKLAAKDCYGPGNKAKFHRAIEAAALAVEGGGQPWESKQSSSDSGDVEAKQHSLVGATVVCDGADMVVMKCMEDRVQLKRPDGKLIWRSLDQVTQTH